MKLRDYVPLMWGAFMDTPSSSREEELANSAQGALKEYVRGSDLMPNVIHRAVGRRSAARLQPVIRDWLAEKLK